MKKILVTGASGLLGGNIASVFGREHELYAAYCKNKVKIKGCKPSKLDICNWDQVKKVFGDLKPEVVVHCAAMANVEYCEENPDEAWMVNVDGTAGVASAAQAIGAKLIHISTDSIFDGDSGNYSEGETPSPVNEYARTKAEAELVVQELCSNYLVIRTNFFGWNIRERLGLAEWMLDELTNGRSINGFTDVIFSPLEATCLADYIMKLIELDLEGIFHLGAGDKCSKYDFAQKMANRFGLDASLIKEASVDNHGFKARRPQDTTLNCSKFARKAGLELPSADEGVQRLKQLLSDGYLDDLKGGDYGKELLDRIELCQKG